MAFNNNDTWTILSPIELAIKNKVEAVGIPLKDWDIQIYRGVLTGFNEAFIISTETRNEILKGCKDDEERKRTEEIIRPILRGRDIKQYAYEWAGLYLIATFPAKHYDIEKYPSLKNYLLSFGQQKLAQTGEKNINGIPNNNARKRTSNEWFETQDSISYWDDFSKPKIIYSEIVQSPRFFLDRKGEFYPEATAFIMKGEHLEYLVRFFNSKVGFYLFKTFYAGGGLGDNGCRYKKQFLEKLPIPKPPKYSDEISDDDLIGLYGLKKQEAEFILSQ